MIKVTLEVDSTRATIESEDGMTLEEVLECVEGAIKGCGYCPSGTLEFVELGE